MASVALIGPDGAGKTTLTRMLEESGFRRFKYMYMGIEIRASNVALPTSRLANGLAGNVKKGLKRRAGSLWAVARLSNRLADEWYRQGVSWLYQLRGFTVLYDRHFVFDFALEVSGTSSDTVERRIHRWFLSRLYPRPDLVVFLDAPGAVLFARKGELTVEELERRRAAFLAVGGTLPMFRRVDATRPMSEVYAEVTEHIARMDGQASRAPVRAGEAAR